MKTLKTLEDEKQEQGETRVSFPLLKSRSISKRLIKFFLFLVSKLHNQNKHHLTTSSDDRLLPPEIIQEILSRLPVKSLLQFRSVSKQWLSLISDDPCFHKLHFTRSRATTSFFIYAYDSDTEEFHFLSAPHHGGPVTHLITIWNPRYFVNETIKTELVNGLVLFTSKYGQNGCWLVLNPATRKVFQLSRPDNSRYFRFFFGFDESKNEHKIFSIIRSIKPPNTMEFMIFSLSSYSWKKIRVEEDEKEMLPPFIDFRDIKYSVCVNSVIHLMLDGKNKLLAFDLTIEKFSVINLPGGARPHRALTWYTRNGKDMVKYNYPLLMNVNGLLGVVCHDRVTETNELHIWILQDYVNRVWVKETIKFYESCFESDYLQPIDYRFMGNIVISLRRLSADRISATILDMNTRSFKLVNFTLSHQFLHSKNLSFHQVGSYVESLLPLREW